MFGVTQLDAAWMAASAGVSVVIASGKAKDGVLQVTAGVTLPEIPMIWQVICSSFHPCTWLQQFMCHSVCVSVCLFLSLSSVCPFVCPSGCLCCLALSVTGGSLVKAACTLQVKMDYKCSALLF